MTDNPLELLHHVGRALWLSTLIGDPPPATMAMRKRMCNPQPGDLVIEVSGFGRGFDPDSIGRLLRIEHPDDPDVIRHVVEPLHRPGEEQGWQNADFVALPDQRDSLRWAEQP